MQIVCRGFWGFLNFNGFQREELLLFFFLLLADGAVESEQKGWEEAQMFPLPLAGPGTQTQGREFEPPSKAAVTFSKSCNSSSSHQFLSKTTEGWCGTPCIMI